jgi:hypothetical protein
MTNDNKMIEIKSLRERIFLKKLLDTQPNITQIVYTPYAGQDKYDATWVQWHPTLQAASRVICEIKVRNYSMTSYTGWVIEKDKYDYLMSQPAEKRLYINVHSDGYQVWDLNKCTEPKWKETILPKNNQGDDDKIKINGDLMSDESEKMMCKNNIYAILGEAEDIWNKRNNKQK